MEEKLRALLGKIEASELTDEQKNSMLGMLVDELEALVQPVLLKYVDAAKLEAAVNDGSSVTIGKYLDVMKDPLTNPEAYKELEGAMDKLLVDFEQVMKEGGLL
jgi:uncharacterized protein YjgD (DUF1641 family)